MILVLACSCSLAGSFPVSSLWGSAKPGGNRLFDGSMPKAFRTLATPLSHKLLWLCHSARRRGVGASVRFRRPTLIASTGRITHAMYSLVISILLTSGPDSYCMGENLPRLLVIPRWSVWVIYVQQNPFYAKRGA